MSDLLKVFCCMFLAGTLLWGCAAHRTLEEGDRLLAEGSYDQAVAHYTDAVAQDPASHEYRMKLLNARSMAAMDHLQRGRQQTEKGNYPAALEEFRLASLLDGSIVAGSQELKKVQNFLEAEKLVDEGRAFYEKHRFFQAKTTLGRALQLHPGHPGARELLKKVNRERMTLLDGYELQLVSTSPITLNFQRVGLKDAFTVLSRLSGINFIFDEEVADNRVTVTLEKASFAQALDILLKMNDLGKRVLNGKTIILFPRTPEKIKQYEDQVIQVFYLSNIDAKKAINMLRTMLQLRKIYVHEELNALVVRDKPEVIRLAQQIIEASDHPDSEVVFDLELVQVLHGDELNLGPKLSTYAVSAGFGNKGGDSLVEDTLPVGGSTANLVYSFSNLESFYTLPTATFEFAKTLSDTEILANPKIRVKNKEKAKVHIGTREPITTTSTSGDIVSTNVQYVDVGVKLDIEANIQLDETVVTGLALEVSTVSDRRFVEESGTTLLTITTTNAQSSLTLKDGERTIIGGLIRDDYTSTREALPFIDNIPLIGNLFSNRARDKKKLEILLSITPHIVRRVEVPPPEVATIWSGGEDDPKAGNRFESFARSFEPEHEKLPPAAGPALSDRDRSWQPAAPGGAMVALQGPPSVKEGDEFTLTVTAFDQKNLQGTPFTLRFPPGLLEAVSIEEGELLGGEGITTLFSSSIDRSEGRIRIEYSRQPGASGASGSGSLAEIGFRAKAAGRVQVELESGRFRDASGQEIPTAPDRTSIEVERAE
jgi:general secretion pathway protein D